mmetsp:Transcript_20276/g.41079  ORF Transcript_20276/g.41079 Transcript_20276/m.41079 type:complete len:200 (+) Transcript_20276:109-708(+)
MNKISISVGPHVHQCVSLLRDARRCSLSPLVRDLPPDFLSGLPPFFLFASFCALLLENSSGGRQSSMSHSIASSLAMAFARDRSPSKTPMLIEGSRPIGWVAQESESIVTTNFVRASSSSSTMSMSTVLSSLYSVLRSIPALSAARSISAFQRKRNSSTDIPAATSGDDSEQSAPSLRGDRSTITLSSGRPPDALHRTI